MTIRSMHDAVQLIGRAAGIADLAPDAHGAFELVFLDQLPVFFQIVGDTEIEVALRMEDGTVRLNDDLIMAMLAANLDLRHGRLAIEPGGDRIVYGGRINIAAQSATTLLPAVTAIIREGASWRLERLAALGHDVASRQSTADVLFETLIRV